jgi:Ni/Co efflux regulator RcnB
MRTVLMTALVVLAMAAVSARAQDFAAGADEAQDAQEKASRDRQRASETAQRDRERAREQSERDRESSRAEERANREDERYERGTEALDEERWDRAIDAFDSVVSMGGRRVDAGLYWKAYAQRKAGVPRTPWPPSASSARPRPRASTSRRRTTSSRRSVRTPAGLLPPSARPTTTRS